MKLYQEYLITYTVMFTTAAHAQVGFLHLDLATAAHAQVGFLHLDLTTAAHAQVDKALEA